MTNKVNVPGLRIVGGVWRTWYRSKRLDKIISRSTGIKADDAEGALKFSRALAQFRTTEWDSPAKYGEARKIHVGAADCHYASMFPPDDSGTIAEKTGIPVEWPVSGMTDTEVISLNEALKRSRKIERENLELTQKLAEKDASEAALLQALGQKATGTKPFNKANDEYLRWGALSGGRGGRAWSFHHNRKRKEHLKYWQSKLKPEMLSDITLPEVRKVLHELAGAPKTKAAYAESIRSMLEWCVKSKYLSENPLADLGKLDTTPQTTRRALTPDEINELLTKCAPARRVLYEMALTSGLRRNELRQLTVGDLDAANSLLRLKPEWTKNRKGGWQPIPRWLMDKLTLMTNGKEKTAALLHMPNDASDTAENFNRDRDKAGIAPETAEGVCNFHSLRTTFCTLVDRAGSTGKESQELARHAPGSPLTQGRYQKVRAVELAAVAERVGAVVARSAV